MTRLLWLSAPCLVPGGVALAVGVAIWRRATTRNRVIVVKPKLRVYRGGRG